MIRRLTLRRFKRFKDETFEFPGHVILAGPNNTGKTTVLQALAAWDLASRRWKELGDYQRHGGGYTKAPISRQTFSAVPLRTFDLLWQGRETRHGIEVEVESSTGWTIAFEFLADSTEQIHVRPRRNVDPDHLRAASLTTVFVPAMTGLSIQEPLYANPQTLDAILSQARPGEVLRNLLVQAHESEIAWRALQESIQRVFGFELLPPDAKGAYITAEYRPLPEGPRFDLASAGSGFQQVLMLLSFLHTRPGAVLLLDEPDAHLHVILQNAIYGELRDVAARQRSQLLIATHSEVIIDSAPPTEICVLVGRPRMLAENREKDLVIRSLGLLSHTDVMLAQDAPGVLYLEDYTDLEILGAWARVLGHRALPLLTTRLFWHRTVVEPVSGGRGTTARRHFEALRLARADLRGVELLDGDGNADLPERETVVDGLERLRWRRYEIESYLIHPTALERFVELQVGPGEASHENRKDLRAYLERTFTGDFLRDPLKPGPLVEAYLASKKARTEVLPPILTTAGLPGFPYTRYHEIAAVMRPDEIHPEVVAKLDAVAQAFGP